MKVVLVPVKEPRRAKQRLASYLSLDERQRLAWAMLEDVTRALRSAVRPDRIVLVTSCSSVMRHAEQNGWDVIEEKKQISESHSVDVSSKLLRQQKACAVLLLPADIPLIQSEDVDLLLSQELEWRSAILVPSRDGTGTNALLRTPPDAFPSCFGKNSFFLHRKEASCRGIHVKVLENPRISCDLDELSDLLRFCRLETETRTAEVLKGVGGLKAILNSK